MTEVYIVGEDDATREIIRKIICYCGEQNFRIITALPARGSQIKQNIKNYNKLSETHPVILLMDLDANDCPLQLIQNLNIEDKNDGLILNIAIDEAEAWLMADRINFAKYFQIDISKIPESRLTYLNGPRAIREMVFPIKASLYLNTYLIPFSRSMKIKEQMLPQENACKGREYNTAVIPFIKGNWDIDNAMKNSVSLSRMVQKIRSLLE